MIEKARLGLVVFVLLLAMPCAAETEQSGLVAPALASYGVSPSGFTVECWVLVKSTPGFDPRILRCVNSDEGPCSYVPAAVWDVSISGLSSRSVGHVFFVLQSDATCHDVQSAARIDDGAFHHIAATYDGTRMNLYIDGRISGSKIARGIRVSVAGGKLVVGNSTRFNSAFDGQIDELRIWKVARSKQEIRRAMNTGLTSISPRLVGYWPFDSDGSDRSEAHNGLASRGHVLFTPGRIGSAADILNTDPAHGLRSAPVPRGDERAPMEWMGALVRSTAALQNLEACFTNRLGRSKATCETCPIQRRHPLPRGFVLDRP